MTATKSPKSFRSIKVNERPALNTSYCDLCSNYVGPVPHRIFSVSADLKSC